MFNRTSAITCVSVLLCGMVSVNGCAPKDPARARSIKAVSSMETVRSELATARTDVDQAIAALKTLQGAQLDLTGPYATFRKEIVELQKSAAGVEARASDMRLRSAEYRTTWQEQTQQLTTPELRAAAEQRAARVAERYSTIETSYQSVADAYQPFITRLQEVRTYLSNDLTLAGVRAAAPAFERARTEGQSLLDQISALDSTLSETTSAMSPTATPAP